MLLSGYPPFYSVHKNNQLSDGMKKKIRAGKYKFDQPEWKRVSNDAKVIIKRMLTVDATQRITLEEIVNCSWLQEPNSEQPIDISPLGDVETRNQIEVRLYR